MPDGQVTTQFPENPESGLVCQFKTVKLIDGATAADNGVWIDTRAFRQFGIEVIGTGTFSVQLAGSNNDTQPLATFAGYSIGSAIATSGLTQVQSAQRWLKASCTVTGGSVSVKAHCIAP